MLERAIEKWEEYEPEYYGDENLEEEEEYVDLPF